MPTLTYFVVTMQIFFYYKKEAHTLWHQVNAKFETARVVLKSVTLLQIHWGPRLEKLIEPR